MSRAAYGRNRIGRTGQASASDEGGAAPYLQCKVKSIFFSSLLGVNVVSLIQPLKSLNCALLAPRLHVSETSTEVLALASLRLLVTDGALQSLRL